MHLCVPHCWRVAPSAEWAALGSCSPGAMGSPGSRIKGPNLGHKNRTKMIVEGTEKHTSTNQMMVEGCRRYHIFGFDLQKRDATGLKPCVSAWDCVSANGMHTGSRTQIQIATSWS